MPQPIQVPLLTEENTLDALGQPVSVGDVVLAGTLEGTLRPAIVIGYRQYAFLIQHTDCYHTTVCLPCDLVKYTNAPQAFIDRMHAQYHATLDFTPSNEGKYTKKYMIFQGSPQDKRNSSCHECDVFVVMLHGSTANDFKFMQRWITEKYNVDPAINVLYSDQPNHARWTRYIHTYPANQWNNFKPSQTTAYSSPTLSQKLLSKKVITGLGLDQYVNTRMSMDEFNLLIADAPLGNGAQIVDVDGIK